MLSLFTGFKFTAIIGAVAVIGMGSMYFLWQTANARLSAANERYETLSTVHAVTVGALTRIQLDIQQNTAALDLERKRRRGVEKVNRNLLKGVDNVESGGCVGPAIESLINGLRFDDSNDNRG